MGGEDDDGEEERGGGSSRIPTSVKAGFSDTRNICDPSNSDGVNVAPYK